jgi:predicted RNA-binding protein YlqC (UPF0109 family)
MEKIVEYIVKQLVDNKDSVKVTTNEVDDSFVITVSVAKDELGRVVGKNGKNAQAIRILVHSLAAKNGLDSRKYTIKFE